MNRWTSLLTQLGDVNHSVVDYERKGQLFWEQIQQASIMVHYKPLIELEVIQKGLSQLGFDDLRQIANTVCESREIKRNNEDFNKSFSVGSKSLGAAGFACGGRMQIVDQGW